jgi:membrane-bound ClpP family serine protease
MLNMLKISEQRGDSMDVNFSGMFTDISLIAALCLSFGLVLVFFEMFIPGFGAPGIFGVGLLVVGITLTARTLAEGMALVLILLAIIGIGLIILFKSATKGKLAKSVVLNEKLTKAAGFSGTADLSGFLDRQGVAQTTLRPAGTAVFDGLKVDVVTEGEFISRGAAVRVIKVEGRRVLVREVGQNS